MPSLDPAVKAALHEGLVIPAHPLALDANRELDEKRQRALTRYYLASGAGGVAVAVHTTQFEIRQEGLLEPVLRLAAEEAAQGAQLRPRPDHPFVKVAGVVGPTEQAVREAELARDLGYDLALLSPGSLDDLNENELLQRAEAVSRVLPLFGFYLQPAVGGRFLSFDFWRRFSALTGVAAVKIAPFNRYATLDVVRGVIASGRGDEVALYTGNDDNIVADLMTKFRLEWDGRVVEKRIVGGLLGQWAVWTESAVRLLERVKQARETGEGYDRLLELGAHLTDANAAVFDAANDFRGCIPGINEVLRRQGLLAGNWCLDPGEKLSPGQLEEIERVRRAYPELTDDGFVAEHLAELLGGDSSP